MPQVGAPVYIELDYKCNHDFMVGAYINYPFSVVNRELLWVTPKEDWNKIYINMTQTVSQSIDNNSINAIKLIISRVLIQINLGKAMRLISGRLMSLR